MLIDDMKPSRFLKKNDFDPEKVVTIQGVKQDNIANEDQPEQIEWLVKFTEMDKPMILKATNMELIAAATGTRDASKWKGKKVLGFSDPTVMMHGKAVGGIRFKAVPAAPVNTQQADDFDDDIPF